MCFDVRNLGDALRKIGMLIVQESVWNKVSQNRNSGRTTRFYIDEMHLLLKEPQTAEYTVGIYKRFRKWKAIPCGLTQNIKDFLASELIESIFENTEFICLLAQAPRDRLILMDKLELSESQAEFVNNSDPGCGLIKFGDTVIPFENKFPKNTHTYRLITTNPNEKSDNQAEILQKEVATV